MQRPTCASNATHFASLVVPWSLILASLFVPAIARAQTAVPPSVGDGLTTATAYQFTELGNLVWLQERVEANQTAGKYYVLMNDIDASETANWNDAGTTTSTLEGFRPIGSIPNGTYFQGVFDGGGHKVVGLRINRPNQEGVGLFGSTDTGAVIGNLSLQGGAVLGESSVGALVGSNSATVIGCSSSCAVTCSSLVMGGMLFTQAGGLVGGNWGGTIRDCFATGPVFAAEVGGLVGEDYSGTITDCFAMGQVAGINCGALLYKDLFGMGTVTNCYATGRVSGTDLSGGLVDVTSGAVVSCYWDAESTGMATSDGGTSETTALMKQQSTFAGWDFANVWAIAPDVNQGYPYLRAAGPPTNPPVKPVAPNPADGATTQALPVTLRWQDGGGATNYDVYFGTANPPVTKLATARTATSFSPPAPPLDRTTTYFWRIDATNAGGTTTGDVWHFTTAPLPPRPSRPGPPVWTLWSR